LRKPLASRIFGFTLLYGAVFFLVVVIQFSNKGNFTFTAGEMTIRGRYLQSPEKNVSAQDQTLTGGVKVFFGGLEFGLKGDNEKGLLLSGTDGIFAAVSPVYMVLSEDSARFELPGGNFLIFSAFNSARGGELRISAEFADDVTEAVIPIMPRRSSVVRENGQLGILYNGSRFLFSRSGQELETGRVVLSAENTAALYRATGKQKVFDPADYVIAHAHSPQSYESALNKLREQSFILWNRNLSALREEDDVVAFCAEALYQGNYKTAVASVPEEFTGGIRHGYRSSGYLGGMARAFRMFTESEKTKMDAVTRLINSVNIDFLAEEHILEFLLTRNNTAIANNAIAFIQGIDPEELLFEHSPGLLEFFSDFRRLRPQAVNPVDRLTDHILSLVSENIHRDAEKDLVYILYNDTADLRFGVRLGKSLLNWAEASENPEWAAVGRSLVLSALSGAVGGTDGASGELYSVLRPGDYYPRAALLSAAGLPAAGSASGFWAWTVSPSVSAATQDGNINIAVSFPVDMSHFVIIRGVRPFVKIQIHDIDFRSDPQFERYDSSGWVYYPQDQALVVKLKHRAATETVRIFYRAERPPVIINEDGADENIGP
jgi:hypothetical protein